MKLLLENWREFVREEMEEPITTLRIFDFDETIAHTESETKVWIPGRSKVKNPEKPDARLKNQKEFEDYMQGEAGKRGIKTFDPVRDLEAVGYEIDLTDFERVVNPEEITIITDIIRQFPENSKTYVMTARRGNSVGPILEYLDEININSSQIRPIATQGESKGNVIARMIANKIMSDGKSNINRVEYYEDSDKNIQDVIDKVCNNEKLDEIKPENFELVIKKVVKLEKGYDFQEISCG